jgi:uncharacterized protein (TIGR02246 family)
VQRDEAEALELVKKATQQWMNGIQQQDATAITQLFTEDAQFFLEGTELKGKETIHKFFQEGFNAGWAANTAPVTEAGFSGNAMYGVGTSVNKDRQGEVTSETNWMAIYKQEGGEWKTYRLMSVNKPMSEGAANDDTITGGGN